MCQFDYNHNAFCRLARFYPGTSDILVSDLDSTKIWSPRTDTIREYRPVASAVSASANGEVLVREQDTAAKQAVIEVWRDGTAEPELIQLPYPIYEQCLEVSPN